MACSTGLSPCRHFSKLRLRMLFCPSLFLLLTCLKRLGHPISFVHFCCIGCFRKLAFLNWFSKRSYCVQLLLDHACFVSHVTFLLVRFWKPFPSSHIWFVCSLWTGVCVYMCLSRSSIYTCTCLCIDYRGIFGSIYTMTNVSIYGRWIDTDRQTAGICPHLFRSEPLAGYAGRGPLPATHMRPCKKQNWKMMQIIFYQYWGLLCR